MWRGLEGVARVGGWKAGKAGRPGARKPDAQRETGLVWIRKQGMDASSVPQRFLPSVSRGSPRPPPNPAAFLLSGTHLCSISSQLNPRKGFLEASTCGMCSMLFCWEVSRF